MRDFWYIKNDFHKARSKRIGASNAPAIIPNPEKPTESLAGYEQTALTVWQEKTGRKERDPAGLPAEMGHYMENKALELFIREMVGYEEGLRFLQEKIAYEMAVKKKLNPSIHGYMPKMNGHQFHHNTQYYNDWFIAHPDMIWIDPDGRPAIVEAKSATYFSALRREGSIVQGYDFDLNTWQGIPLKHYVQIQFQLALFEIDTAYLSLIYDTSKHQIWKIEANREHQTEIINLASKLAKCIETDTPPRELIINQADVKELYPNVQDDFTILSGEKLEKATEYAKAGKYAAKQKKIWEDKEQDAKDALSTMLLSMGELRDTQGSIAKWGFKKDFAKLKKPSSDKTKDGFLKYLSKNDLITYRYLKRKKYIVPPGEPTRSVKITWKE